MRKINYLIAMLAVAVAFGFSAAEITAVFSVNPEESTVKWVGRKVTGEHYGTVALKSGNLDIQDGQLKGGSFVVDMTSIVSDDLTGEYKGKLEGHLKSDDFFGVENYPEAKFIVTKAVKKGGNQYDVTGDLTVKGKTNVVTFPAEVVITDKNAYATATITVDRSKYDVRYGSGSFFDNLGDKTIYDNFELQVKLVANN
ncbi:MAG: YceI family protein [Candidatus Cyclobacteriaceae bacterium M2_1C_046]